MPPTAKVIKTGVIYVPKEVYRPNIKVEITRNDDTIDDISAYILDCSITKPISIGVNSFTLRITNPYGIHINKWIGGETINIWLDFGSATTKQFQGVIEAPFFNFGLNGHTMTFEGRGIGNELLEVQSFGTFSNVDASTIADSLIASYSTTISYTPISTGYVIDSIQFEEQLVWNSLQDLFTRANHDFYVDVNGVLQHFEVGSSYNEDEYVVHGMNMIELNMGVDIREVKNRVRNYGAVISNDVILLSTQEDSASQTLYGIRELSHTNTSLQSFASVDGEAQTLLIPTPTNHGTFKSIGLPNLLPGENIRISSPYDNVLGWFRVGELTHSYSVSEGFTTSGVIEKLRETTETKFDEVFEFIENSRTTKNANAMKYSYVLKFDGSDSITLTNTQLLDGALKLATGENTGNAISATYDAPLGITSFELRLDGDDLADSIIYVSNNAGVDEEEAIANTVVNFGVSGGDKLRIRIELANDTDSPDPTIRTIGILYK